MKIHFTTIAQKINFLKVFFIIFAMYSTTFLGQELPPIIKYSTSIYAAGNQNWMITQDKNQNIFFANNDGLLEFNGSTWSLYKSPNETIIRSVKVINNKVYTGCYMEFGFWTKQSTGQLKYTSLSQKIKNKIQDDEQFWNIINYDKWVLFQSLSRIYIYETKSGTFTIIAPKNIINKSFSTGAGIYFQIQNEGLYEIENGLSKLISNNDILKTSRITNIFAIDEGLLIQTQNNGRYKLTGATVSKFAMDSAIESSSIYSAHLLSDGGYALGTISNGLFIVSSAGKLLYHITQNRGLSNNTVLSLFEDADKNLWVGLDNGINCINLQSPVKSFSDDTGFFGTVYASILHNSKLYIGTNQGLFVKDNNTNATFQFVNGTKGQVWSLFDNDGTLFCGHDSGTFIIENGTAKNIFSASGTWKFVTVPNQSNLMVQGNYFGLSVLEKVNNQWRFRNKIVGFDYSSRYFEFAGRNIFVSHEYKGIFNIELDNALSKVSSFKTLTAPSKGKNASLTKFNNTIYYAYSGGIFKFNNLTKQFEKDKLLSAVFEKDTYTSGKLIVDKSNKIWIFSKNYIHYFTTSKLGNELKENNISIPSSLTNSMLGYENITQLSNSEYLIGTTDGYYRMNLNGLSFKNYNVALTNISVNKLDQHIINSSITTEGSYSHDENNISFSYAVPEYNKYIDAEYKYQLVGFQDNWSEWSSKSTINFKNLPTGFYTFKVKAKIANSEAENVATYSFRINKPWYATIFAIFCYILLGIYVANYVHSANKKHYQQQQEKLIDENNLLLEIQQLENEQQLMKLKNEQLSQDFDAKNKELAVSTMSLIKKDELLALIRQDLKNSTAEGGINNIKSVISNITRNITDDKSWNVFKEAFDTADKDFLKKVKTAHPSLTPNDLRLCAYLRLNLSSKEIAPLINISVRSVEIKRYRLRKKMELNHEQGLIDYILSI